MSFFEDFRYDYAGLYRTFLIVGMMLCIVAIGAVMPDNEATRAMGLIALRERGAALREALYWELRAAINPGGTLVPVVDYGFVIGIDFDGSVFVMLPVKKDFVRRKIKLADVQVSKLRVREVAALIQARRQMNARIEMYGDMAVIWFDGKPLNIDLVNANLATPDPNPPTNIVDRIFATYFWSKVKGSKT